MQVGYWSLFVDETLDKGMSRESATFNSPCLAAQEEFAVSLGRCLLLPTAGVILAVPEALWHGSCCMLVSKRPLPFCFF